MESAIPDHLRKLRIHHRNTPPDFQPPNPAWVSRFGKLVDGVVMAYFGIQSRELIDEALLSIYSGFFSLPDGPGFWEWARNSDALSYDTIIAIAYWDNQETYRTWRNDSGFDTWWLDAARLDEPYGYFLEVVKPSVDRFETIQSSPENPQGIACLQNHVSGEIEEHAYWGAMRDRIPLSQVDELRGQEHTPLELSETIGKRILLPGYDNLCLIRSGKDYSATLGLERELYLNEILPTLVSGMNYLRDEGASVGCLSCRYMTVLDREGHPVEETFGLAYFDDLSNLEKWAKTHSSHSLIYKRFLNYVKELDFKIDLRLYHEVAVVPACGQHFEYVNCHPGTGLLGGRDN